VYLTGTPLAGLPKVDPFHLEKVFVWVPEYIWPEVDHIPCPKCGYRKSPDGWNFHPRRVVLEEDIGCVIGFRYGTTCASLYGFNMVLGAITNVQTVVVVMSIYEPPAD